MSIVKGNPLKKEKLRSKSIDELKEMLVEAKSSMFAKRTQRVSGQLENYREIPQTRRRIALLRTLIREKELGGKG